MTVSCWGYARRLLALYRLYYTPQKSFGGDYKTRSHVYMHAKRSHTHVKDPVVHVIVQWIGSRDCWLERRTRDRKVASSNHGRSGGEFFFLQSLLCVLTLTRCPFHTRVTTVTRKRPRSFCKKCRWQVTPKHAYILDPSKSECADHAAVQAECGNLSENELTRNPSGNTRLQSSQLAEPLWTDHDLKSEEFCAS